MNDELNLRFQEAADRFEIPSGDVDAVIRRSRHRTARRRTGAALVMASVVVGAGVFQLADDGVDDTPVAAGGGVRSGESGITWRRTDVRSALGQGVTAGRGPVYALSTAAGEREAPRRTGMFWRSDNGVEWSSVSALAGDIYLADLAPRDRRIYAVGTGPATAAAGGRSVSDFVVGWSDDEGRTWQRSTLAIDLAGMARKASRVVVAQPEIEVGPNGAVAAALVNVELDVPRLLPAGVTAPHGWAVTERGIDVLGPRAADACPRDTKAIAPTGAPQRIDGVWCESDDGEARAVPAQQAHGVTASFTFAELGVAGDLLAAVRRQPFVFTAAPGSTTFRRSAAPDVGNVSTLDMAADDDGFHLAVGTYDRSDPVGNPKGAAELLVFTSPDGSAWSGGAKVGDADAPATVGLLGDRMAALTQGTRGSGLVLADGSGGWTTVALSSVIDPDVLDGRAVHMVAGDIGPLGVVAVVLLASEGDGPTTQRLLVSRDGVTWEDHSLDDLVGQAKSSVTRVSVGERQAVVQVGVPVQGKREPRRQVAVVGSLD